MRLPTLQSGWIHTCAAVSTALVNGASWKVRSAGEAGDQRRCPLETRLTLSSPMPGHQRTLSRTLTGTATVVLPSTSSMG